MLPVTRGQATSEVLIEINWVEIIAESEQTGGSPILSYNLQYRVKDSGLLFTDLTGEEGNL